MHVRLLRRQQQKKHAIVSRVHHCRRLGRTRPLAHPAEPRARRAELAAQPQRVREILADGASRARKKAAQVLQRAKLACGLA